MREYRIIPFSRSFDSRGLSYVSEKKLLEGSIVKIPYGKGSDMGCVMEEIGEYDPQKSELKTVGEILFAGELLAQEARKTIDYIAQRYFVPIHHALLLYLPKNLREKLEKGTYEKVKTSGYHYNFTSDISLSGAQENIYKAIAEEQKQDHFLLYGVTGSGKTSIYIHLIQDILSQGKQILVLIPEIILSSQIAQRLQAVFGSDVLLIHSGVSAAKKTQYWKDIATCNAKLIVGTRSAMFYPYRDLEMIIMDEAHDPSYNSDSAPRYEGLDIVEFIASQYGAKLLLGTGTSRATTLYRALKGELLLLQLLEVYSQTSAKKKH